MIKFFGILVNEDKTLFFILQKIQGLNYKKATLICYKSGLHPYTLIKNISLINISILYKSIEKFEITISDLKMITYNNVKILIKTRNYRGLRHLQNLPSRGQQTRSNARTARKKLFKT